MATETDAIQMTIEAWQATQPEGAYPRFQVYEPNGGTAMWTPAQFASEEFLAELLGEEWETAELKDGALDLFRHRGRVLRYASLTWGADPSQGRMKVAFFGAHCGFEWECPDERTRTAALKAVLVYCGWDREALAEFGLACCEDYLYGDDGGFWLVADLQRFARTVARCLGHQAVCEEEDRDLEIEELLTFLREED